MSFWQSLLNWIHSFRRGKPQQEAPAPLTVESIALRLEQYADRCRNAGDPSGERDARVAARAARSAPNIERALEHEENLFRAHGFRPANRIERALIGQCNGHSFVRFNHHVRIDGSKSWRFNNPGYVLCTDPTRSYGAISCDGTHAVFRSEQEGLAALTQMFRLEHATKTVLQALSDQLPGISIDAILRQSYELGIQGSDRIQDLSEISLNTLSNVVRDHGDWEAGQVFERGGFESSRETAPDWLQEIWSLPTPQSGSGDSGIRS